GVTAKTASNHFLELGNRLLVGMVGYGSIRKGADIFYEVAKKVSKHDFIWVGNWNDTHVPFYEDFLTDRLDNFFITGEVENPY
ncbi:hypothetical protein Q8G50_33505, partial [Klebsiella pneumoniae]